MLQGYNFTVLKWNCIYGILKSDRLIECLTEFSLQQIENCKPLKTWQSYKKYKKWKRLKLCLKMNLQNKIISLSPNFLSTLIPLSLTVAECWCRSNIDNLSPLKLSPVTSLYTNNQVKFQGVLHLRAKNHLNHAAPGFVVCSSCSID